MAEPEATGPGLPYAMRDTLFGDLPLARWAGHAGEGGVWASFAAAARLVEAGDRPAAVAALKAIAATPDLESRHYLEAWQALRELGVAPPPGEAKTVLGVVVEVGLNGGLDLLAAYQDHCARYYNYSGAAVVWEHPDPSLDPSIDELIARGQQVCLRVGPWENPRPPAPPQGTVRLNLLTPSGLHFGQGQFEAIAADPLAGPLFEAAAALMRQLVAKVPEQD